ncbi:MAG TPA: OmpA family protein [Chryseolinea sp.]|nr:OmpA family protein [Chryseolinea sp.]
MNNVIKYVILIGLLCYSNPLFCQNSDELAPGYYVVVAAYAKSRENVAQNFVEVLRLKGLSPSYGFNSSRNLYFVYLKYFDNLKESLQDMKHTRGKGEFTDAWVRVVHGDIGSSGNVSSTSPAAPSSPPVTTERPNAADVPTETKPVAVDSQPASSALPPAESETEVTENPPIAQYPVMTLGNTEVFLSLYNARNNRIVDGMVEVVDTDRSRLMTKVKGNEYLLLPDPKSKSGQLTLICEAFGYRKIQEEINYPLPLADTVKSYIDLMGTTLVINFDLVRYHRGDIATLYNVYFFNDAALMLPESKFELNSLLQLMNENPNYKIRLHGHTNGNYTGKIFTAGKDKDYFSLDGAQQAMGSAKDLSRGRAEVIRDYLVSNGVSSSRMEIKAWGGKRPIYDKNSANAKKNVRVEVEILEE